MSLKFTKMHALGNDFMVVDGINQKFGLSAEKISKLSNRFTGIGFDQLLLLEKSISPLIDFNYRIFNANGHEVGQCGNGARCLALFIQKKKLSCKTSLRVKTNTTELQLQILSNHQVSVEMAVPRWKPKEIPFISTSAKTKYSLTFDNEIVDFHVMNVGNPHAVLVVEQTDDAPLNSIGAKLSIDNHFPEHTNVGFMQIINKEHIKLRVYERDCAETLACGSGATAAVAVGRLYYQLAPEVKVTVLGGELWVNWKDFQQPIYLRGSASFVYEGEFDNFD